MEMRIKMFNEVHFDSKYSYKVSRKIIEFLNEKTLNKKILFLLIFGSIIQQMRHVQV